jgi:hypothetical protein
MAEVVGCGARAGARASRPATRSWSARSWECARGERGDLLVAEADLLGLHLVGVGLVARVPHGADGEDDDLPHARVERCLGDLGVHEL